MDQFDQNNLEFQWPLWGTFDLPKFVFLRTKLEDHISQIKQTEWNAYFNWLLEASKCIQDSKIPSLQNTISKLIEENKQLEKIKKLLRSLLPLLYHLCLQVHSSHLVPRSWPWCHFPFFLCAVLSSHSIPFTGLPIFCELLPTFTSPEPIKIFLFKSGPLKIQMINP